MDPRTFPDFVLVYCPFSHGVAFKVPYRYGVYQDKVYPVEINVCDNGSADPVCKTCTLLVLAYLLGQDCSDSRFRIESKASK